MLKCPVCEFEGNSTEITAHLFEVHGWSVVEIEDWFEFGEISHIEEAEG
jgi:serine kinase of HPr protein (carbohydrate metabolism regulator)